MRNAFRVLAGATLTAALSTCGGAPLQPVEETLPTRFPGLLWSEILLHSRHQLPKRRRWILESWKRPIATPRPCSRS